MKTKTAVKKLSTHQTNVMKLLCYWESCGGGGICPAKPEMYLERHLADYGVKAHMLEKTLYSLIKIGMVEVFGYHATYRLTDLGYESLRKHPINSLPHSDHWKADFHAARLEYRENHNARKLYKMCYSALRATKHGDQIVKDTYPLDCGAIASHFLSWFPSEIKKAARESFWDKDK